MSRVLIVSHEPVGERLAGPAMRAVEMARALGAAHEVTLAVPAASRAYPAGLRTVPYTHDQVAGLAAAHDVAVLSGLTLNFSPGIREAGVPLVLDIYIPFLLEELQAAGSQPMDRQRTHHASLLNAMLQQLEWGDFFLCASEKQRDFWLGALAAAGRLNPDNYQRDPTFRDLIDTAGFGVPARLPEPRPGVLKGDGAPFDPGDTILYWGGGLYDWFDPLALIEAVARLRSAGRRDLKLFFAGVRHPNPDVHEMRIVSEAQRLAGDLGLDGAVVFNDWVPYEERGAYLLEADAGVSLHLDHLETRFSFRTRLLDYLWAGLPMVLSAGDTMGEELATAGVAALATDRDVDGVAAAIERMTQPAMRQSLASRFDALREQCAWERVLEPLERFCRAPRIAADGELRSRRPQGASRAGKALDHVRHGRFTELVGEARRYVEWRRRR